MGQGGGDATTSGFLPELETKVSPGTGMFETPRATCLRREGLSEDHTRERCLRAVKTASSSKGKASSEEKVDLDGHPGWRIRARWKEHHVKWTTFGTKVFLNCAKVPGRANRSRGSWRPSRRHGCRTHSRRMFTSALQWPECFKLAKIGWLSGR